MKKEFIPYEQALELKELGFDEPCFGFYDESLYFPNNENQYGTFCNQKLDPSSCSAPLYQQAFRLFRDSYNLFSTINVDKTMEPKFCYSIARYETSQFFEGWYDEVFNSDLYYTQEEAELDLLKKLIEITKES